MCGFSGVLSTRAIDTEGLTKSLKVISHRGPDANGIYISKDHYCGLAHVRLSILDPSPLANQPIKSKNAVMVYNGEVYNHLEIRQKLSVDFGTTSDTETVLRGFLLKGNEIFDMMSGMFSGAIYCETKRELTLFRDSLGIKNVYFYQTTDSIYFSSEIKSLLSLIPYTNKVNGDVIKNYLSFENYPQGTTFFKGIQNLVPGEIKKVKIAHVLESSESFISPQIKKYSYTGDLVAQGKQIIEESVRAHLLSDVPLGVYLSGGIDSSLVATIAARHVRNLEGFTGYFETNDSYYDERYYARLVAKSAGIKLNEIKITPEDFKENFDKVIWHLDEPRMGMGAFSQYIVAKEVAKKRKVILAGHGGDELFGGYPMFKAFWLLSRIGLNAQTLNLVRKIKSREWIWISYLLYKKLREGKLYFAPELFENKTSPLNSNFYTKIKHNALEQLISYYKDFYIPGLLVVEDKISMAHSLETRVPLWSNELYNWAYNIPPEDKLVNGELKYLLKRIAHDYLPMEIFKAEKRGFPTPLRLWFRTDLKEFIRERLLHSNFFLDQYVSLKEREKIIKEHLTGEASFAFDEKRAHKIWMLLSLESWSRQFGI